MKILWVSDSPQVPSSYGTQTRLLTPRLQQLDIVDEIVIFAPAYIGYPMEVEGVRMLGGYADLRGNDLLAEHALREKVDLIITFKDPYVYQPEILRSLPVPWVPVCAIDTEPVASMVLNTLRFASRVIALSPTGARTLRDAGHDPLLIPLGVDLTVFKRAEKAAVRKQLGLPPDSFIACYVGANQGDGGRKNLPALMLAWAEFIKEHPTAILILHTDISGARGGLDFDQTMEDLEIPDANVWQSDPYQYLMGFSSAYVAKLYQASDVLVNATCGEGFGLPVVEAQAVGCPVITTQWTAMRDYTWAGITIPATFRDGMKVYPTPGGAWWQPSPAAIKYTLDLMVEGPPANISEVAVEKAQQFEINGVVRSYWEPALNDLAALLLEGKL